MDNVTIVTAVNPKYAARAAKTLPIWMNTPGLKEHQFIIFVNGFRSRNQRKFLEYPNTKVIRWDYPHPASVRETMLAAFVLGVAEHVQTDYWMKLDCDTLPKKDHFTWPEVTGNTIVSHRWRRTKMKGADGATEHWFTTLDRLFAGKHPLFNPPLDLEKYRRHVSHRRRNPWRIPVRFASFCHIEQTRFTRRMAKLIHKKCGGRMPIASQDTLSWYMSTIWKEPVKLVNFKEWFDPTLR